MLRSGYVNAVSQLGTEHVEDAPVLLLVFLEENPRLCGVSVECSDECTGCGIMKGWDFYFK